MTSKRIELLDIEKLKTELRRLERRRGRSGKDATDHPPRGSEISQTLSPGLFGSHPKRGNSSCQKNTEREFVPIGTFIWRGLAAVLAWSVSGDSLNGFQP